MSATTREREQFIAQLVKALPDKPAPLVVDYARRIMRAAATHGRLAVMSCNGCREQGNRYLTAQQINKAQERFDARIEREEKRIEALITRHATWLGLAADFGGDPRGYTVKLHLPTGGYNTWGGKEEGYGVPQ